MITASALKYVSKKVILIFNFSITFAIFDRFYLFFARGKVTLHRLGCGRKFSKNYQLSTEKMKMINYTSVVPRPCQNQIYNYIPLELLYWKNIAHFISLIGLFMFSPHRSVFALYSGVHIPFLFLIW